MCRYVITTPSLHPFNIRTASELHCYGITPVDYGLVTFERYHCFDASIAIRFPVNSKFSHHPLLPLLPFLSLLTWRCMAQAMARVWCKNFRWGPWGRDDAIVGRCLLAVHAGNLLQHHRPDRLALASFAFIGNKGRLPLLDGPDCPT